MQNYQAPQQPQGPPPQQKVMRLLVSMWTAKSVATFAELGIPDYLDSKTRSSAQIAKKLSLENVDGVERLCRAVASAGYLEAVGDSYKLTDAGRVLMTEGMGSLRAVLMSEMDAAHWSAWSNLTQSVATGEPGLTISDPEATSLWSYYSRQPDLCATFQHSQASMGIAPILAIMEAYEFPTLGVDTVVDVGGGKGTWLEFVLAKYAGLAGILFEGPEVATEVEKGIKADEKHPFKDRVKVVGGSVFEKVPKGDLFLLKHVLHHFKDSECIMILKNIKKSFRSPHSRICVSEMPIDLKMSESGLGTKMALFGDLNCLVTGGGRERTKSQYLELFEKAGLKLVKWQKTESPYVVMELARDDVSI